MILDKQQVQARYASVAPFYGLAHLGFAALGLERRRRALVADLGLAPGDTVLDLGCGTGVNFAALHDAVGAEGRIVAIDISGAMLRRARARIATAGWRNVELRQADLSTATFPRAASGAIATFALEMVPDHPAILDRVIGALGVGRRVGLMGAKMPHGWPAPLVDAGIFVLRPFGVSRDYADIRPWIALGERATIMRHDELLGGAAYACVGKIGSA